ncbi:MAG: CoB--CoM heterodisulfide reductase iron-sulfur subunit B family protein [Promethearchaeota archaeon]
MTEYSLFTGCVIPNRIPFIEASARKVFEKLGVTFKDVPFTCCPDPTGTVMVSKDVWLGLGAGNLAMAEAEGKPVCSLCNGCTQTLKAVQHEINHHPKSKKLANHLLSGTGKEVKGDAVIKHFVDVLRNDVGVDNVKAAVTKSLAGLKIACHTGCHYSRPSEVMQIDDPFEPKFLRELVAATGAEPVDYEEEWLCCGSAVANVDNDTALNLSLRKFKSAVEAGADAFVVCCPACFQRLENCQRDLKKAGFEKQVPIIYVTELLALAMGLSAADINLKMHRVKAKEIIEKFGL